MGATTPFGMVRLGPDTAGDLPRDLAGFAHTSGYWYADRFIEGFSHLHLSGTGVEDLGTLLVAPALGMSADKTTEAGYRQAFSHDDESATPGRYAVTLEDTGVHVELTATPRDRRGAARHEVEVSYATDAPEVASFDSFGRLQLHVAGRVTASAEAEGHRAELAPEVPHRRAVVAAGGEEPAGGADDVVAAVPGHTS